MPSLTTELVLSPFLIRLFQISETNCVYECCGIEAFEFDRASARRIARQFGARALDDAVQELLALIRLCAKRNQQLKCEMLNWSTGHEESRTQFVAFFKDLRALLLGVWRIS